MARTSVSLLERISRGDDPASWQCLTAMYAPLLHQWLSRYHVQESDRDDLVQEVLLYIAGELPEFEHSGRPGAFRGWLRTILVYRLRKFWQARDRRPTATGDTGVLEQIAELEDPASGMSQIWEQEHNQYLAEILMKMIQPRFSESTWRAFCRTVLDGATIQEAAKELKMTRNAVCFAKSRVLRELRQEGRGFID